MRHSTSQTVRRRFRPGRAHFKADDTIAHGATAADLIGRTFAAVAAGPDWAVPSLRRCGQSGLCEGHVLAIKDRAEEPRPTDVAAHDVQAESRSVAHIARLAHVASCMLLNIARCSSSAHRLQLLAAQPCSPSPRLGCLAHSAPHRAPHCCHGCERLAPVLIWAALALGIDSVCSRGPRRRSESRSGCFSPLARRAEDQRRATRWTYSAVPRGTRRRTLSAVRHGLDGPERQRIISRVRGPRQCKSEHSLKYHDCW